MPSKSCRALVALAAVLGCLPLRAQEAAKVYIGGGDEHRGAFDGYLNDPAGWTWVRQNADGYYVNTFPLKDKGDEPALNAQLNGMAGLFTHRNVFYETEAESYAHRVHRAEEARLLLLVGHQAQAEHAGLDVAVAGLVDRLEHPHGLADQFWGEAGGHQQLAPRSWAVLRQLRATRVERGINSLARI
ncbi:MAG: hypothetical protein INR62_03305 [Rhodospirillales bacterium]|nr:hypothetical protein [Acetobacter sp.]